MNQIYIVVNMKTTDLKHTKVDVYQTRGDKIELQVIVATREKRHRAKTRDVNRALLRQLDAFNGGTVCLQDVTESFCMRFANFLLDRVAVGSARTYLHKLHAVLQYALERHLIVHNPMPPVGGLVPCNTTMRRTYLSIRELQLLSNTPCPHAETKRAFLFACQTGLRLSDIETLRWDDIVMSEGVSTIVKTQVKTGKEVRVPLNTIANGLLGECKTEGLIFKLNSRSVIATDLRRWAEDARITKKLTFHVSRHTFATISISAGVDIYVVSKLCGHTNVKTTEIYAHMLDSTLLRGVNLLSNSFMENIHHRHKNVVIGLFRSVKCKMVDFIKRRRQQDGIPYH